VKDDFMMIVEIPFVVNGVNDYMSEPPYNVDAVIKKSEKTI
jgi:hypothetical protein